jgi:hypothetical protein
LKLERFFKAPVEGWPAACDFDGEGKQIVTAENGQAVVRSFPELETIHESKRFQKQIDAVKFIPGTTRIFFGGSGLGAQLWDYSSNTLFELSNVVASNFAVAAGTGMIVARNSSMSESALVFDKTGASLGESFPHGACDVDKCDLMIAVAIDPSGEWIAAVSESQESIRIVEWRSGKLIQEIPFSMQYNDKIAFSRNGRYFAASGRAKTIIWEIQKR